MRHSLLLVVVAVLVVLAGGAGFGWAAQWSSAQQWQQVATDQAAEFDRAAAQLDLVAEERDEAVELLARSERDVAALEAQIDEVAGARAAAGDDVVELQVGAQRFAEAVADVEEATGELIGCVEGFAGLHRDSVLLFNAEGPAASPEALNRQSERVSQRCDQAFERHATAVAALRRAAP